MRILLSILLNGIAVYTAAYLLKGVIIENFWIAIIAGIVLALVNLVIKPILFMLTIPLTVITLGLFVLVINALMVLLADLLVPGFDVSNFWWALLFSVVLALINFLFEKLNLK